jgi:two-component system, OmpR family, sensor kinase
LRLFWLAAHTALLFALLIGILLALALHLFGRVVGTDVVNEIGTLRVRQGVLLAERLEAVHGQVPFDRAACLALLRSAEAEHGMEIALSDSSGHSLAGADRRPTYIPHGPWRGIDVDGRACQIAGPPGLQIRIPVLENGRQVATLTMTGALHSRESHRAFLHGLIVIGLAGLVGVVLLSLYLTAPLRRMSRSMDRIASGDLEHRVGTRGRDEVAAMGESFNAMADRIQGMVRGQKELLAGVSHELRSPLARMKVSTELLREGGAPRERLADLEADVDAVDQLVEELLIASRLDFGAASIKPEEVSLQELASEAWARVATDAEKAGMTLWLGIADDARTLRVDPSLGLRVLGNLFENAVRYADRGVVTLASRRVDDGIEVSVADEGPGVSDPHLNRLFEPFFRVDPSRSRKTGSTGLGLMIVQRAVQAHGGQVRAARAAGGGLVVTFRLPVAQ